MRIVDARRTCREAGLCAGLASAFVLTLAAVASAQTSVPQVVAEADASAPATASAPAAAPSPRAGQDEQPMDHSMELAGGPTINFRGFMDMNFGVGSDANALIFPL